MGCTEKAILNALSSGEFLLSVHAVRRMGQRCITSADIRACGRTAKSCIYQSRQRTWRIEGADSDKEPLIVICGIDQAVVIVTMF
jgi:hypothetical protein